jgi:hypothetical protein
MYAAKVGLLLFELLTCFIKLEASRRAGLDAPTLYVLHSKVFLSATV